MQTDLCRDNSSREEVAGGVLWLGLCVAVLLSVLRTDPTYRNNTQRLGRAC